MGTPLKLLFSVLLSGNPVECLRRTGRSLRDCLKEDRPRSLAFLKYLAQLPETRDDRGIEKHTEEDAGRVCTVLFLRLPLQRKTHMMRVN